MNPLLADNRRLQTNGNAITLGSRPRAMGKFLFVGREKFYVRGVTYGPFRADREGSEYHEAAVVQRDFAQMRQHGINAVRTYTVPPRWLLDLAAQYDLRILIGLPWEQHITFLATRRQARDIERRIRSGVKACAGHPALLGYAIGNEIPSPLVRWYGHHQIESFLLGLYHAAKAEDPEGLVTYVNYPSTEYLELPFLDFAAFNLYLESQAQLQAYLARLQNISNERPLVMGEIGLDSLRNGEERQAQALEQQGHDVFEAGCAGLFFFSWTDEWCRGGHDIEDWKFGLTTVQRQPKPALESVSRIFRELPMWKAGRRPAEHGVPRVLPSGAEATIAYKFDASRRAGDCRPAEAALSWPSFSVVVCTYNGSRTLPSCLSAVKRLAYPGKLEVIVVDDGSRDGSAELASGFGVRLIRIPNGGLSHARNVGWQSTENELVAYLDDDAAPDEHWLVYLALGFMSGEYAGVGGPNVAWPNAGWVAECVEHAPGNPTHVLLTDREAEHLPGCNMAFRKECLAAMGGFDEQFRIAGDDVDLCWRLQERGWKLGFHPAAMVFHRRRSTIRGYWKQQLNYGKAEAMLERKWPEKYNVVGHTTWNGRLYRKRPFSLLSLSQRRIYHGTWGSALFQSVYNTAPGTLASILMLPEWYLVIMLLAVISLLGSVYPPLRYALFLLALAFVPPLAHAALNGARAFYRLSPYSLLCHSRLIIGTAWLHFLQPGARLWGRLCYGLTPWRRRGSGRLLFPRPRVLDIWSETQWQSAEQRLRIFEETLRGTGAAVTRGGEFDRWDLQARVGLLGAARLLLVVEEHGAGKQFVRMRFWPLAQPLPLIVACLFALLACVAALDLQWTAWALLNVPAIFLVARTIYECAAAMAVIQHAISANPHSTLPKVAGVGKAAALPVPEPAATAGS